MASHGVARTTRSRTEEERQQELDKIDKYRSLEDQIRQQVALPRHPLALIRASQFGSETFKLTSKLLRLNPEYYTVWNARRRCLISGPLSKPSDGPLPSKASPSSLANATHTSSSAGSSASSSAETRSSLNSQRAGTSGTTLDDDEEHEPQCSDGAHPETDAGQAQDVIRSELVFIVPLLMQHPKCYWIWHYRMWILQQAIDRLHVSVAKAIWEEELGLVGKMLHKDRRNYHAWAYRRHVVAQLESPSLMGQSMTEAEFQYTTKMIHMDLSNFSAWHNRSQLICRLLDERAADDASRKKLLDDELNLARNALNVGPDDQSLWYYHQFLVSNVIEQGRRPTMVPRLTTEERMSCISNEIEAIKELLEDYVNVKWIYEILMEYTLAISQLTGQSVEGKESDEVAHWLSKLRELDPMRNGRWDDLESEMGLV